MVARKQSMKSRIPTLINPGVRINPDGTVTPFVGLKFPDPIPIVIQAIVESVGTTDEGSLIATLDPAWREINRLLAADPAALFLLSPRQLEELVAASYEKAGYDEVVLTPRSGDFGRDVIAVKRGWGSIRIIDQVKAYRSGHSVTANDVRALLGVLAGDPRASKGIVTTTSTFAPRLQSDPFVSPFMPYRLELVDGESLRQRLILMGE